MKPPKDMTDEDLARGIKDEQQRGVDAASMLEASLMRLEKMRREWLERRKRVRRSTPPGGAK